MDTLPFYVKIGGRLIGRFADMRDAALFAMHKSKKDINYVNVWSDDFVSIVSSWRNGKMT